MNADRRAKANQAKRLLQAALSLIESLVDAEETALEGIPENMQMRVERCEDTLSDLVDAKSSIEDAVRQVESATER